MNTESRVELENLLTNLPLDEQKIWLDEAVRLSGLIVRYQTLKRKRKINRKTGKYEFTIEVLELCKEAITSNPVIVSRESNRARPPSPYTMDKWARDFNCAGPKMFIRAAYKQSDIKLDKRRVQISAEAVNWVNENWRTFKSPRFLYNQWKELAEANNWQIPSVKSANIVG